MDIILLNGPSSAGKSTLSRELRRRLAEREIDSVVISIDDYMITDPKETIYEDDIFEIMPGMCRDMKKAVKEGKTVIVDHAITSERIYQAFMDAANEAMELRGERGELAGKVFTVKVTCAPKILLQREMERGDRCPGSAETSLKYLWPKEGYDLCIDNGKKTAAENGETILGALYGTMSRGR